MSEPLPPDYLLKCEQNARQFSGCWDQGTSGTLAAHVMRLLGEVQRLKVALARYEERPPYWLQAHD